MFLFCSKFYVVVLNVRSLRNPYGFILIDFCAHLPSPDKMKYAAFNAGGVLSQVAPAKCWPGPPPLAFRWGGGSPPPARPTPRTLAGLPPPARQTLRAVFVWFGALGFR